MTKLTTLVTGATGFTGRHLITHLQGLQRVVIGTVRRPVDGFFACDLTRREEVRALLEKHRPNEIFHCAGTFTNRWDPDFSTNALAAKHLLELVAELGLPCRVLLIGSAAEYGWPDAGAVPETAPLRPVSIYGLTKVMQTEIMGFAHRQLNADVVMARTFNLLGEGCSPHLFPGRVATQIAQFKAGTIDRIRVGNLESRRDYLQVESAVANYVRILLRGESGEVYNVGSGTATRIRDLLARMLLEAGLDFTAIEQTEPRKQNADPAEVYAEVTKLSSL